VGGASGAPDEKGTAGGIKRGTHLLRLTHFYTLTHTHTHARTQMQDSHTHAHF
jgi:hypothetical protein